MIATMDREELAHHHGLQSFANLLEISHPLPPMPGELYRCYLAHHADGHWFIWDDGPFDEAPSVDAEMSRNPAFRSESEPRSPSKEQGSHDTRNAASQDRESRGPANQSFSGPMRNGG